MNRKIIGAVVEIIFIISLMFAEYRYIMLNIEPYLGDNQTVYIEIFGRTDEYYAEHINLSD